jgi:hypothetical protein
MPRNLNKVLLRRKKQKKKSQFKIAQKKSLKAIVTAKRIRKDPKDQWKTIKINNLMF